MMPTTREIVFQLRALAELHPKDTISDLANKLGLSPIFIINALEQGEKMHLFKRKRDKKGALTEELIVLEPTDWDKAYTDEEFGPDHQRVRNEIIIAVTNANMDEQDLELGTIMAWCRGVNPSAVETMLALLTNTGLLRSYELADPGDKKSKYTFYTLGANVNNEWGRKQFKKGKK